MQAWLWKTKHDGGKVRVEVGKGHNSRVMMSVPASTCWHQRYMGR
jgi:hypothetical protein